jgi:thioredoxin reductase
MMSTSSDLHNKSGAEIPRISRSVAVIGGGSAGVVTARFLKRAGHRPTLFEAGAAFGGVWASKATNEVVYKNLQTNLPTVIMQSPDLDFPRGVPSYITKEQLGSYIEDYAQEFGIVPLANLNAKVTKVVPAEDEQWKVEWTSGGILHTDIFDAVVVANGHYEKPFRPTVPGEEEWLAADPSRAILHSREYDDPESFRGQSVLVVGGRASGVDISRMLQGNAKWVYVLEKKCEEPVVHEDLAVAHVPVGARLASDGHLRIGDSKIPGPPVARVILATGYVYNFPFIDEDALDMRFHSGGRSIVPLYQHLVHATRPSLGFVGIPLSVPCPIPFFEIQAAFLAEHWARPHSGPNALSSMEERKAWVEQRFAAVGKRAQDVHLTGAGGGSAWSYMRELLAHVHVVRPPNHEGNSWLERSDWEARLTTVEHIYRDRASRYPKRPWDDDAYRRCEYSVDWGTGDWSVEDSRTQK